MKNIEIFDPAMCCSTGVCGPSIDSELMRVAALLSTLKSVGFEIKRYNLGNEPQAFIDNQAINDLLQEQGADVLPVTLVDGQPMVTKGYPTNAQFSEWLGLPIPEEKKSSGGCGCGDGGCC